MVSTGEEQHGKLIKLRGREKVNRPYAYPLSFFMQMEWEGSGSYVHFCRISLGKLNGSPRIDLLVDEITLAGGNGPNRPLVTVQLVSYPRVIIVPFIFSCC